MRGKVWMMSMSPHGNHVVQKCIATFLPHKLQFIINAFKDHVVKASCDMMQSRVVERIFEYCPPQQTTLLLKEALDHAPKLLTHPYGNFVMQSLLVHGADEHRSTLVTKMRLGILRFSRNKISKGIVCKAMWYSSMVDKLLLFNEICVNLTNLGGHENGKMVIEEMRCILQYLSSK
jgi:pumilio RNA-binding family